jgi:ubiquinone/menaquinone biosynthesis C-methylase UbiE
MNGYAILGGALAAIWAADALRLRGRARSLATLAPHEAAASAAPGDDYVFAARAGVAIDEDTRRAAVAYARARDLDVLDLVAPGLATWRALVLLSVIDPATFGRDRFARGVSAGDAMLVKRSVLERARVDADAPNSLALVELARTLKLHAATSFDLAIAPRLRSPGLSLAERRRMLRLLFGDVIAPLFVLQFALVALAIAFAPFWGLAALLVFHLQPLFILAGTRLAPVDRAAYWLLRPIVDAASTIGPAAPLPVARVTADELRPVYDALLANGTASFFEPARDDCPLCRSRELSKLGEFPDHYQRKPGRFTLSRCRACGHVFQNPRLSLEGLAFYYRDFYDGLGEELTQTVFGTETSSYRARARMVADVAKPRRWLDVGAGHGHFCCFARDLLPDTRFDGLDLSESIDHAVRRRWVDRGIRGLFPEVAQKIADGGDSYDVVSMSHYLEHTLDPAAEIDAAARVLENRGLLLIEVPDPESRLGALLGRAWLPWFQPQHLHFLTVKNIERLLVERSFEPLAWHRGEAHQPAEFTYMTLFTLNRIALSTDVPWRPKAGPLGRTWRRLVWSAALPLVGVGWALDHALAPLLRRARWSNTYRVLARRVA